MTDVVPPSAAVIEDLQREIATLKAALAQRNSEYGERIAHQAATIDVLKAMSASPGDPQPVFDLIARQAARLCDAPTAAVATFDGTLVHLATQSGFDPAYADAYVSQFPRTVGLDFAMGRAILNRRIDQVEDIATYQGHSFTDVLGHWSVMAVPMLRDDTPLGAITIGRPAAGPFSNSQVALLQTFAEQAVIAIASAETYRGLIEALEQQTATAEVLGVINSSPGDLAPVFDAMLERAMRLCDAAFGVLWTHDGECGHAAALRGVPAAFAAYLTRIPHPVEPGGVHSRLLDGEPVVHIADAAKDRAYRSSNPLRRALVELGGARTMLAVPLRKDNAHLGHFVIYRREVRPFSDKQIELVQNFASQAVIAMENARLITEQREALEQQTATAEVLRVINASPGNLVPVFDTILEKALRLCGAAFGSLVTFDGELFHFGVTRGMSSALVEALRQRGPVRPNASIAYDQIARGADIVHIADITDPQRPPPPSSPNIHQDGARTTLFVALRGDDVLLGAFVIYRKEVRPFSDKQIALLKNFADQAVIAMENARLLNEQREALEQQTATAEVLRVINTNPGNLAPVFATILEKAHATCGAQMGSLQIWDGTHVRALATQGYPADVDAMLRRPFLPGTHHLGMIAGDRLSHRIDAALGPNPDNIGEGFRDRSGIRTNLHVPLRRDGIVIGFITANRREVRPFSDREISLLENFAAHAVIAMENARLINETREALEQQTATAEVLQVINASPGNLEPVFDVILEKAHNLCGATRGSFITFNGERFQLTATRGLSDAYKRILRNFNNSSLRAGYATEELSPREQLLNGADSVQLIGPAVTVGPIGRAATELERIGTVLFVPLRRDGKLLGYITAYREEEASFTDKQIAVLQNFAAQAVIAMENARLLNEVRQRQEELRITFEHMGDGVAMFDESQHLVASNGKFQEIFDLPPALLGQHSTYEELLRFLAARGDFGESVETAQQISDLVATTGQPYGYERTRPDGRVIEIRRNPVPGGGFVLIFSDITERKRSEQQIRAARDAAEAAYRDLKAAQASLIQAEKMASLGQLTAGIAHEIKNPLNFVNNFADLSADLLNELHEALAARRQAEIDDLTATLKGNLAKIAEHGRRADSIVKNMLLHSRSGPSEHRLTDLNAVVEEALNLAYHGARAETPGFNMTMQKQLDPAAGMVEIFPQEFTRVLLNLISNGFYAARQRSASADGTFEPTLLVATRDLGDQVQIQVRDNGTGMNEEVQTRIFEPFFTTKPAGEGTGLGLSLSYDIIVKQHGGQVTVQSRPNEFTEFVITLPRKMPANQGGHA